MEALLAWMEVNLITTSSWFEFGGGISCFVPYSGWFWKANEVNLVSCGVWVR